jgi:hypothetical protein
MQTSNPSNDTKKHTTKSRETIPLNSLDGDSPLVKAKQELLNRDLQDMYIHKNLIDTKVPLHCPKRAGCTFGFSHAA